jgi:hypothetical protein
VKRKWKEENRVQRILTQMDFRKELPTDSLRTVHTYPLDRLNALPVQRTTLEIVILGSWPDLLKVKLSI